MEIKVKRAIGSADKTTSTLDLTSGLDKLSAEARSRIHQEVGDYLVETTLSRVAKARSPLKNQAFDPLSPKYKKKKVDEGGVPLANLELSGEMLDSLAYEETEDGIELGHMGGPSGQGRWPQQLERGLIPPSAPLLAGHGR